MSIPLLIIITGIVCLAGYLLFFNFYVPYFANKKRGKKEDRTFDINLLGMLPKLIGGFVCILIGLSILPVISSKVGEMQNFSSVNGLSNVSLGTFSPLEEDILKFTPVAFALGVVGIGGAIVFNLLRNEEFP